MAVCLLAACQHSETQYVDFQTFHVLSTKSSDIVLPDGSLNPEIQMMDDDEKETKVAKTTMTEIVRELLSSIQSNTVVQLAGTYQGHDVNGSPLTLSGKVILPKSGPIKNMILVSHYTIGSNKECPSEAFPLEGILASRGYAVVIADYIGFGVTRKMVHPYMHVESTARAVVDMGLAVKPYLEHVGRKPQSDQVILFGYSQGGSTTLGVLKMIQNECWDTLPVKQVYAGGGPYDLAATYDIAMEEDYLGIPCAIPMIIQGINVGENLGLDMKDFFKTKLLENYNEWINSKNYTNSQINKFIGTKSLKEILTDQARDKASPKTAKLYKALMINSVLNFSPKAPVFMLHSREDKTVPFVNSEKAEQYFKGQNVTYDFGNYGVHTMGFLRFLITVNRIQLPIYTMSRSRRNSFSVSSICIPTTPFAFCAPRFGSESTLAIYYSRRTGSFPYKFLLVNGPALSYNLETEFTRHYGTQEVKGNADERRDHIRHRHTARRRRPGQPAAGHSRTVRRGPG